MALAYSIISRHSCFGTKKLSSLGSDLGKAVKGFKEGIKTPDEDAQEKKEIEGEVIKAKQDENTSEKTKS